MVSARNFSSCPHCARAGRNRTIGPSTLRTPLVPRSDGRTYHLYLEESNVLRPDGGTGELAGLFRYDLDPAGVTAESTLVRTARAAAGAERAPLEDVADRLAALLESGKVLCRVYTVGADGNLVEASAHFPPVNAPHP
jgi:hypothetical protein